MSGWKTVDTKRNRKVKKAARDDDFSDSDYDNYGNTDYRIIRSSPTTAAGRLMSQYHQQKAEAAKGHVPSRVELANAKASQAEELEKKRAERKATAADAARVKRREAQEHAKRANDASQWPTVAQQLAEQSEAFMDHFDAVMDDDPIVSRGGIGALLLYAPSIFEKFLFKTRLTSEEAAGEVYLVSNVESQEEDYGEAQDTFVYYKSLLTKMPEVKTAHTSPASQQAVQDGLLAMLSAVWGTKGLKNALASKDAGRGGIVAIELTFEQLWALGLQNIAAIADMFVNAEKGEAHTSQSIANFHRIFTIMTNAANAAEDKDAGRVAIARAAAVLLTTGYFTALFTQSGGNAVAVGSPASTTSGGKKKGGNAAASPKASSPTTATADEDSAALIEVMASAVRYVSTKQLTNKTYAGLSWRDAAPYADYIVKTRLEGAPLNSAWAVLAIELLARQNPTLAKAMVAPLLEALERELSTAETFSPAESTLVVVLSTVFALHASAAAPALKAHAAAAPKAAFVFLAVAKASKLFDVAPSLEETIVAAVKRSGAQAPRMNSSALKVADVPPAVNAKAANAAEGGKKKAAAGGQKGADAGEEAAKKSEGGGGGYLRMLMSFVMIGIASALLMSNFEAGGVSSKSSSSKASSSARKTATR